MSSAFFEAVTNIQTPIERKSHKLYFDEEGCIIDISYDVLPGNYIEITEDEYSMCYQKRQDYTIIENKLTFSPPKQRTWGLVQKDLSRNPYICNK